MTLFHVAIVGAGPAGLSAALSIASKSTAQSPIRITILELRDKLQPHGGAVNLTPLALRYLDALNVGERLRPLGSRVGALEFVSHRTGGLLGRLWPDADALRVRRQVLVETMMAALEEASLASTAQSVESVHVQTRVILGAKIQTIEELPSSIRITFRKTRSSSSAAAAAEDEKAGEASAEALEEALEADVLVGCDGMHSQVRTQFVDPQRQKTYSGKCNAFAFSHAVTPAETARWLRADGRPLIADSTMVSKGKQSLLATFHTAAHDSLYLAAVMPLDGKGEKGTNAAADDDDDDDDDDRALPVDEWAAALGADKVALRRRIQATYADGKLACLPEILDRCDDWLFFPVYSLPPGGIWARGRAILLGDAAHGMPPQGESTGVAIEDGVLLAHVLTRRTSRSVPQLFADYEKLRRADIDAAYKETMARWNMPVMSSFLMEWLTWAYIKLINVQVHHFMRDVRFFDLPK